MRRSVVHSLVAVVGLVTIGVPVVSAPASAEPLQEDDSGGEFVIAFAGGNTAAAIEAVAAAGGHVLDVNEALDIALVEGGEGFSDALSEASEIVAVARNHSIGTVRPGMPHRFVEERPSAEDRATAQRQAPPGRSGATEPLADLQWNMEMIGAFEAHRRATGRGVTVGVMDTGVDASHPDLAPNFSHELSRNFTMDIPEVDGPCEVPTCIDPAHVDDGGHGTHVAGIIAAARNRLGISGVAPDATIVNIRAGQDSGFFFVYETVAALTYAGDIGLDVVNMSFFTDPWLYNCDSLDDYVSGEVTEEELAQQAFIKATVLAGLEYAHERGVTLVAAAGNQHFNLALDVRPDAISPDYPAGSERPRVVTSDCPDLPSEGPQVIGVSAVGPSTTKSDYSNYGLNEVEISAPGGWFRDFVGTPMFMTPNNMILSSYPLHVAIEEELADENGQPTDDFSILDCNRRGECGFYTYLQGTSMASPHVAGVAALVVEEHGRRGRGGYSLDPDIVRSILEATATDHACPAGGVEIYTDEGRPAEFNAICEGTTVDNGFYGEGIVNAVAAVARM